jgi:uncharacterized protein
MIAASALALSMTFVAVLVGAATQSIVGFGMNLVAVPVALLAGADELVPAALLVVLVVQAATLAFGEGNRAEWGVLTWFLPVRFVGTFVGVVATASLSGDTTIVVICVLVLAGVLGSVRGWRVPSTRTAYMATGFVSGFSNVISSIGGPALAIAMTDREPAVQRATQGWSAMLGSLLSIALLAGADRFAVADLGRGAALIPAALLGSAAVRPIRHRLPTADALRPWVWSVATVGSIVVIVRTLVT